MFSLIAVLGASLTTLAGPAFWSEDEFFGTQTVYRLKYFDRPGVKAVMIKASPYHEAETRVFALYGLPEGASPSNRVPGVVCVHGGLGTAHEEWVRLWNSRGYAAIAMDNCGGLPVKGMESPYTFYRGDLGWLRHRYSGPIGWGGWDRVMKDAPEEQWTYHAVGAVLRSHSFLRSLPEVDASRIGITGISWGGYLTCLAASVDGRFAWAAPVYGCGRYDLCDLMRSRGGSMTPEARAKWLSLWDPSVYLRRANCPFLWVTGNRDFAYPLNAVTGSADLIPRPVAFSVIPDMVHGQEEGAAPEEIRAFADSVVRGGKDVVRFTVPRTEGGFFETTLAAAGREIAQAFLLVTSDRTERWQDRNWRKVATAVPADGKVRLALPRDWTAAVFTIVTADGLHFSTKPVFPDEIAYVGHGTATDGVYRAAGPFAGGRIYHLAFEAQPATGAAATSEAGFGEFDTPNAGNYTFTLETGGWTPCAVAMRMADETSALPKRIRLGGYAKASLRFRNPEVREVKARYRAVKGLTLGHDEWVDGDTYHHVMRLCAPVGNVSRALVSVKDAYYNVYRWWLFPGGTLTYRYALDGRAFRSAKLAVPCTHYTRGEAAVEASVDGAAWTELGRVTRSGESFFDLPAAFFPAKEVFVRYRALGDSSLQIGSAEFEAKVDGKRVRAFGRTELVDAESGETLDVGREPFAAREDFGTRLPGGKDGVRLWSASSGWKVMRTRDVPVMARETLRVSASANEAEAVQLVVRADRPLRDVRVAATRLADDGGAELPASSVDVLRVGYVKVTTPTDTLGTPGLWPDPLPPQDGTPLDVASGENQPFWVRVKPPKGTRRGLYRGTLRVTAAGGFATETPFEVEVFGFEFPDEVTCLTSFGYKPERSIDIYHGVKTPAERAELLDKYLAALGDAHLAPNQLPYFDWKVTWKASPDGDKAKAEPVFDWDAWDAAMERIFAKHHFNAFRVPVVGLGHACLQDSGFAGESGAPSINGVPETDPAYDVLMAKYYGEIVRHLTAKGWLDKAYFYWFDEPSEGDYPAVQKGMAKLKKYAPGIRRIITEELEPGLFGGANVWVPTPARQHSPYAAERRKAGDEFWWYVCCGPHTPYVGEFIDHPGVDLRTWLWQTWDEGVTGVLIWETTWWTDKDAYPDRPQNPYRDPMSWASRQNGRKLAWGNGDGRFLYPPLAAADGRPAKPVLEGPVGCQRLEMLRDGLEDYEYFVILKRLLGERGGSLPAWERAAFENLLKVPSAVSRSLVDYNCDPIAMEVHRKALARAIERLSGTRPPEAACAIQRRIDDCANRGGGRVTLGPGTHDAGCLTLRSGVELHLEKGAVLRAPATMAGYPQREAAGADLLLAPRYNSAAFIFAEGATNVAITGEGTIDANGNGFVEPVPRTAWGWRFRRVKGRTPPRVVWLLGCRDVRIEGVTMVNQPAGWSYWISDCDNVLVDGITIDANVAYPNNDGVHVNSSRDVVVRNSRIECGDDSIVMRANNVTLAENKVCERVVVSNCTLRSYANGIRIGWINDGTIRNGLFKDIRIHKSTNGVGLVLPGIGAPSDVGREPTRIENLTFEDITMDSIYFHPVVCRVNPGPDTWFDAITGVTFRNVRARGLDLPKVAAPPDKAPAPFVCENCDFQMLPPDQIDCAGETWPSPERAAGAHSPRRTTVIAPDGDCR